MTTIHKMIKDAHGHNVCLCTTHGRKMLGYRWNRVTCKKCLELKELDLNDKQLREIARIRYQKIVDAFMEA